MNKRGKGEEGAAVQTLLHTNQLTFTAKQRRFLRFIESLPTISEEPDGLLFQQSCKKWSLSTEKRRDQTNCHCNTQDPRDVACQVAGETVATRDVFFFPTDDPETPLKYTVKSSKLQSMNKARVLFPEFFPPSKPQDSCDDCNATMEQIFSKQNDFSEKCDKHENYEYWKRYHLSF